MTTPPPGQSGFDLSGFFDFRTHLLDAASHALAQIEPTFVSDMQSRLAGKQDITAGPPPPMNDRFKRYRSLLNDTYELELAIHSLRVSTLLLAAPGRAAEHEVLQVNEAEQFLHHFQMWSYSVGSLFDRAKHVLAVSVRQLIRPIDRAKADATETQIKASLEAAYDAHRNIRDSFAHGRGVFEQLADTGTWERASATKLWPQTRLAPNEIYRNSQTYRQATRLAGERAFRDINGVMVDLDAAIDWDAVKARRP
jgi:hypothetical protein